MGGVGGRVLTELLIDPWGAFRVLVATVVIYLVFVVLVRVVGQRSLATMSSYDIACVMAAGAVLGRTTLLSVPTLGSGVVALLVLFTIQLLLRRLRRGQWAGRVLDRSAVLLVVDGKRNGTAMRRAGITADELRQRVRLAGISRWEHVGQVVLERNGQISVVRQDANLDLDLFDDVAGVSSTKQGSLRTSMRR